MESLLRARLDAGAEELAQGFLAVLHGDCVLYELHVVELLRGVVEDHLRVGDALTTSRIALRVPLRGDDAVFREARYSGVCERRVRPRPEHESVGRSSGPVCPLMPCN